MSILLPLPTSETWTTHFTSRGWTTPQDQVAAGFPRYCQPVPATGSYSEVFDFGSVISACRTKAMSDLTTAIGTPGLTVSLDVSANGTDWTAYSGQASIFSSNVRYVRARIDATSDGLSVARISQLDVTLDAKLKSDAGQATAVHTDASGTRVDFGVQFADLRSVTATPGLPSMSYAVVSLDNADPTGFRVLLYDQTGTRISGTVYWAAKGY